jgi:poly(3-hydroxybutyrate) depolymerase
MISLRRFAQTLAATALLALAPFALGAEAAPGKQVEQTLTVDGDTISYLLYLPAEYDSKASHPLMLFLHDAQKQ